MPRVLTCLDPQPAADGSCASSAWLDQPGLLPPLPVEQGLVISGGLLSVMATAWVWSYLRRYVSPKTG